MSFLETPILVTVLAGMLHLQDWDEARGGAGGELPPEPELANQEVAAGEKGG